MPGYGEVGDPADDFGWDGFPGNSTWMHYVGNETSTQIIFAVLGNCFGGDPTAEPASMTIAGFDALYAEPFDPTYLAHGIGRMGNDDEKADAYALDVSARTLCIYVVWEGKGVPAHLAAAREIVESIRAEPIGRDGIRIVFTSAGWDNA